MRKTKVSIVVRTSILISLAVIITTIVLISAIPLQAGSDAAEEPTASVQTRTAHVQNETITLDKTVNPAAYARKQQSRSAASYAMEPTFENLSKSSTTVVLGTIQNLEYTTFEGSAYTKASLYIQKVLAGRAEQGSTVSVFLQEGYIPLREISKWEREQGGDKEKYTEEQLDTVIVQENPEIGRLAKTGDSGVFYLAPESLTPEWAGGYELSIGRYSYFPQRADKKFESNFTGEALTIAEMKERTDNQLLNENVKQNINKAQSHRVSEG